MVDTQLIKDTIKELLDANVDKDTIYSTLEDIGVERESIEKYYAEMSKETKDKNEETNNSKSEDIQESQKPTKDKKPVYNSISDVDKKDEIIEDTKDSLKIKEDLEKQEKDTKQEEELKTTTEDVDKLTKEHETKESNFNNLDIDSKDSNEIIEKINKLEEDLTNIKVEINGLTKIMKNILEENRNILNKL
jgi:hypothetical protein